MVHRRLLRHLHLNDHALRLDLPHHHVWHLLHDDCVCIYFMIMSWRFFVFSPALAAVVLMPFLISCPAPMDDFIIIFITLSPIAIHETTQEQVVPHLPGFRVRNKALQLASSTRTSYLHLILLKHLGLHGAQKPIHNALGHRADHGRLRGRAKRYFRTKMFLAWLCLKIGPKRMHSAKFSPKRKWINILAKYWQLSHFKYRYLQNPKICNTTIICNTTNIRRSRP